MLRRSREESGNGAHASNDAATVTNRAICKIVHKTTLGTTAARIPRLRSIHLRHVLDQVHDAARVAPLVVVPSDALHEGRVQHDASLRVECAGNGAGLKVRGHERLVAVAQESLHVALRAPLNLRADVL